MDRKFIKLLCISNILIHENPPRKLDALEIGKIYEGYDDTIYLYRMKSDIVTQYSKYLFIKLSEHIANTIKEILL